VKSIYDKTAKEPTKDPIFIGDLHGFCHKLLDVLHSQL